MSARRLTVLLSVGALAMAAVIALDRGDIASGARHGIHRVNILDLQSIVAKVLHPVESGIGRDADNRKSVNVLDLQRALTRAHHYGSPTRVPSTKPACKVCFFRYQDGRLLDPTEEDAESEEAVPVSMPSRVFSRPARSIVPRSTERYLFRLTPNAPPFCT